MRNIFLFLFFTCVSSSGYSQTMRASIGPGSSANKVMIYIKPDANVNGTIATLAFNIAIQSTINPAPTLTVSQTVLSGFNWVIGNSYVESGYRHYAVATAASPTVTIGANVETAVLEVEFTGGTGTANVYSMTLPDGGLTDGNALFLCTGEANSNGSDLYYTRTGPPATTVVNGFSYPGGTDISYATFAGVQMGSGSGSTITDYFRTITSGDWNAATTWESSPVADFTSGVISPATLTPDNNSNVISIRNNHTVTVTANVTTDQTFINPGGALVVNASTLTVINNGLTVQSTNTGTGRIGNSTGTITGNVTVERFIPDAGKRAWRLLSGKSVSGSQTIYDSWQEGGSLDAGKGTWITSTLHNGTNGFDATNANLASIITHVQGGGSGPSWNYNLANTNATALSAHQGYMLFVRGDRNYQASTPGRSTTTLKTTGSLNQGNQPTVSVSATGSGYTLVGNPFASPIDLENILTTTNLSQFFYIWDATVAGTNGVGGFRLVQKTGAGTYTTTPTTGNDNSLRYIHSGQAFFLKASGSDANVVITEAHKASSLSVVNPFNPVPGDQQIYTELVSMGAGNTESVTDGVRVWFNPNFSANTTDDIHKMGNFGENISSYRGGKKWIVELRPMIGSKDTIFLQTSNLAVKDYRLKINTFDFVQTSHQAFLKDNWTNTLTPLNLNGSVVNYDFSVTTDPASANPNRFMILFAANGPLPVTITGITAQQQGSDIAVEWKVINQLNIDRYEVERSANGSQFARVETQQAITTNNGNATYNWLDVNPGPGDHFYRVRSIGSNGDVKLSQVVKVTIGKVKPIITVYPNPVVGKTASLAFNNLEKGKYLLRLVNAQGQVVESRQLVHGGGSAAYPVVFTGNPAAGTYVLEIVYPDKQKTSIPLVLAD